VNADDDEDLERIWKETIEVQWTGFARKWTGKQK
jgi:hypothetical protein